MRQEPRTFRSPDRDKGGTGPASLDYYKNLATNYETEVEKFVPGYHTMISSIWIALNKPLTSEPVYVDLGSGPGHVAEWFLTFIYPKKMYLVDSEPSMTRASKERFKNFDPSDTDRLMFRTEDILTFRPDEPVDAVYSSLVLHNMPTVKKRDALKNIHSYLKDGGTFIWADLVVLDDPAKQAEAVAYRKQYALAHGADPAFVDINFKKESTEDYPITIDEMRQLLLDTGFKDIETCDQRSTFVCLSAKK
jgi:tRNA (cmo5U34)-methyltransferase